MQEKLGDFNFNNFDQNENVEMRSPHVHDDESVYYGEWLIGTNIM